MKLLLTGGAGFIGLNFLKELYESKSYEKFDEIYSIDKMEEVGKFNAKEYYDLCNKMNIIIIDKNILEIEKLSQGKYVVFNFASESHVDKSIEFPYSLYIENCETVPKLFKLIGMYNIITFYHISTDEVFGDLPYDFDNNIKKGFNINDNFNPSNPYSASKASQEMFLNSMKHTFNVNIKIIRLANQYGSNQYKEKMIPKFINLTKDGNTISVFGKGNNKRQWTNIDITSKIFIDILNNKIVFDEYLHIANKHSLKSTMDVCNIMSIIFKDHNIPFNIKHITDRIGHDRCYFLETTEEIDSYYENENFENNLRKLIETDLRWNK